jgi:hypothetical protein
MSSGVISLPSAARGACQWRLANPQIAHYNQTHFPFLSTRPTSTFALPPSFFCTLVHPKSFICRHIPSTSPSHRPSFRLGRSAPVSLLPAGSLQYIPWPSSIYHEETYRRILRIPHPAAFSVTCTTTTLPLLPYSRLTRLFCLETSAGRTPPDSDVNCACRQPSCHASTQGYPICLSEAWSRRTLPRSKQDADITSRYRSGTPVFGLHGTTSVACWPRQISLYRKPPPNIAHTTTPDP